MYFKLGQACVTVWGSFVSLQIKANVITKQSSYYKLGHKMYLRYKLGQLCFITNQGKCYYKLGQLHYYKFGQPLFQSTTIITNWGITCTIWARSLVRVERRYMLAISSSLGCRNIVVLVSFERCLCEFVMLFLVVSAMEVG